MFYRVKFWSVRASQQAEEGSLQSEVWPDPEANRDRWAAHQARADGWLWQDAHWLEKSNKCEIYDCDNMIDSNLKG